MMQTYNQVVAESFANKFRITQPINSEEDKRRKWT